MVNEIVRMKLESLLGMVLWKLCIYIRRGPLVVFSNA